MEIFDYEAGDREALPPAWRRRLAMVGYPIAIPLMFLMLGLGMILNWILLDTHHINLSIQPKGDRC